MEGPSYIFVIFEGKIGINYKPDDVYSYKWIDELIFLVFIGMEWIWLV